MDNLSYTTLSVDEIFKILGTRQEGLSDLEVKKRQKDFGSNQLSQQEIYGLPIFFRQLKSPFIYLLVAATIIALFLQEYVEAGMIFFFVAANTLLGFYQEYKAEQTIMLLRKYILSTVKVRREGKDSSVMSTSLVPGDVIILEPGDVIPADVRFIEASELMVDESTMTGESVPIEKRKDALKTIPEQFFQASNIGIMGTTVVGGKGIGVVFATAQQTMMGSIAQLTQQAERDTIFAKEMRSFSRFVIALVLSTLVIVLILNLLFKGMYVSLGQLFLFSIALAVTITPEALPIVITFCLSRGALKLAQNKVIVKRLSAIEDLGSIDILCSDKTGTLTENILAVADIFGKEPQTVLKYAALAASSVTKDHQKHRLNPIDEACMVALKAEQKAEIAGYKIVYEVLFDHVRLRNTVVVEHNGVYEVIVRGVFETMIARIKSSEDQKKEIFNWTQQQELQGRRVLVITKKTGNDAHAIEHEAQDEENHDLVGLLALADPIKKDVQQAIIKAKQLGIVLKILTGDSPQVAQSVGTNIGLISSSKQVITGPEFEQLTTQEKKRAVYDYTIFARVEPQQKFEIVQLLQEKNQVGYMGDGINDAPALKVAHVALVVQGAADIARDAADIILLKKSLNVIIDGIYQGRIVFANTVKYLKTTFSALFGNFYSVALVSLFLDFLPMLPLQILLINLLSDLPLIAISTDTVDIQELRKPTTYAFKDLLLLSTMLAIVSSCCDFMVVFLFYRISPEVLQTNWFIESVLTSLLAIYSVRTKFVFFKAKRPSFILIGLTIIAGAITLILPLTKLGRDLFHFSPPTGDMYAKIIVIVLLCFTGTELAKLLYYRLLNGRNNNYKTLNP